MTARLLYLMAFFIPFASVGPTVMGFTIAPAFLFGSLYAVWTLDVRRFTRLQAAAVAMILAFFLTALPRHGLMSFMPSLMALSVILMPASRTIRSPEHCEALFNGFRAGLMFTVAVVTIEIGAQLLGASGLYSTITNLVRNGDTIIRAHNQFLFYYRPYGFMSEPAHLAVYLASGYVFLDVTGEPRDTIARRLLVGAFVFLTGSVSGLLLLTTYIVSKTVLTMASMPRLSFGMLRRALVVALLLCGVGIAFGDTLASALGGILDRVDSAATAIGSNKMNGSEGSRANAYLVLPAYWSEAGLAGMLFGTGYANYSEWVANHFRFVGPLSAFTRGDVNNMLFAVFLSTGLLGCGLFLNFIRELFDANGVKLVSAIGIFALVFQFFYGTLVSYFYWDVLLIVLTACRITRSEKSRT